MFEQMKIIAIKKMQARYTFLSYVYCCLKPEKIPNSNLNYLMAIFVTYFCYFVDVSKKKGKFQ